MRQHGWPRCKGCHWHRETGLRTLFEAPEETEGGPRQHSLPGQSAGKSVQAEAVAEGLPQGDRRRRRKRRQASSSKEESSFGSGSGLSTNEGLEEEQGESR